MKSPASSFIEAIRRLATTTDILRQGEYPFRPRVVIRFRPQAIQNAFLSVLGLRVLASTMHGCV